MEKDILLEICERHSQALECVYYETYNDFARYAHALMKDLPFINDVIIKYDYTKLKFESNGIFFKFGTNNDWANIDILDIDHVLELINAGVSVNFDCKGVYLRPNKKEIELMQKLADLINVWQNYIDERFKK